MAQKILIVDDSLTNRSLLRAILKKEGYRLVEAEDGEVAIRKALEEIPDLILLDIMMPHKDGFEVCTYLKSREETMAIPVIFLSAMSEKSDKVKGLNLGAVDYVTKPFNAAEVLARVRTQLKVYALTKRLFDANQALQEKQRILAQKNAELERLNEEKNKFLGMAAHDLRNPLIVIRGFSEFLLEQSSPPLSEDFAEMLSAIHSQSEFMLTLVNDLLDISKIESGTLELKWVTTDLVSLIEHTITLNQILAERKQIRIDFRCDAQCRRSMSAVLLDPQKIEQVLNNLISNAVKYSAAGSPVLVTLARGGKGLLVQVRDQGQGIPKDEMDKLFRPFQTTRATSTDGEKSTGLGLTIVRRLVEGHGGAVWAESEPGHGSTFSFTLPMA
ncbi:hybrid sensor histidine kinase/response regulator [Desulfoferrobacter suflitae]|uniref:hybrid sensor histidine kinase/response regulator n=1 Tax=Desulfoferrobacter suflitae TaxID=2865782 RepID=UPI002164D849|nr:hybrid sensor histidine kinase/response regulator [Desulfoferrobacter suflitae]MCK8601233.1 hybrid sensor histidine kinase/response regulator [Desulfoferrobacter suflitae]